MVETWRAIPEFEGLYEVSDFGRVRSVRGRHGDEQILDATLPPYPRYKAVSLHKEGKRTRKTVHALVALAFLQPKPPGRVEVRHLDGDRGNNRADNLAWGTQKENAADRIRHGRQPRGKSHGMYGRSLSGELNGVAKLSEATVREIKAATGTQRAIAARFNISQTTVWKVRAGKSWTHLEARENG